MPPPADPLRVAQHAFLLTRTGRQAYDTGLTEGEHRGFIIGLALGSLLGSLATFLFSKLLT
jgi:hypothetical protein